MPGNNAAVRDVLWAMWRSFAVAVLVAAFTSGCAVRTGAYVGPVQPVGYAYGAYEPVYVAPPPVVVAPAPVFVHPHLYVGSRWGHRYRRW